MAELFNKVCTMTIGDSPGRVFKSPPFSLGFEQKIAGGVANATTAQLYNPNPDTIAAATPKNVGGVMRMPQIIIDAGYEDEHGVCILGQIYATEVKRQGSNVILEMKISEQTAKWTGAIINKTYVKMTATAIIYAMLGEVGIAPGSVKVGKEKTYKTPFTAGTLSWALQQICRDTDSTLYFGAGVVTIQPKTPAGTKMAVFLNSGSGLLNRPEKTSIGVKFQTLFLYKLGGGSLVKIESKTINGLYSIVAGSKKFSTFQNSECDFEAVAV
jgi:hypothetical protein